jgi:hypothetical protein
MGNRTRRNHQELSRRLRWLIARPGKATETAPPVIELQLSATSMTIWWSVRPAADGRVSDRELLSNSCYWCQCMTLASAAARLHRHFDRICREESAVFDGIPDIELHDEVDKGALVAIFVLADVERARLRLNDVGCDIEHVFGP